MIHLAGCPTALSWAETLLLQRWSRNRKVVEFGALLGHSTINIAEVATSVISVDLHTGYSGDTFRRFRSNIERAGLSHRVIPLIADVWKMRLPIKADIGFIDLTGTFDLTLHAIRKINAPIIALHDIGRPFCRGAEKAMLQSGRKIIDSVDTLVVLGRNLC